MNDGNVGEERETRYVAVKNDEEQYSIWPVDRALPVGWTSCGSEGSKQECLEFIKRVWTDMRPRSLREHLTKVDRE
jgi:MbtH protein